MHPRNRASRPGTTPWNTVLVRLRFASVKFIFCSVSRYMMLMLLPLSTMHLVNSTPSINGLMTMAYWFSVGTRSGWYILSQVIGTSDQRRYWGTGGEWPSGSLERSSIVGRWGCQGNCGRLGPYLRRGSCPCRRSWRRAWGQCPHPCHLNPWTPPPSSYPCPCLAVYSSDFACNRTPGLP